MSIFEINKFCRRVLHDREFRCLAITDPKQAVSMFQFNDAERDALLNGDVANLHRLGASAFLLLILSRFEIFGLKLPIYNKRMRNSHHIQGRHS